jgi:hypothetical protein
VKIAFLCTSLNPGRDGVGDYSRRLAAACVRHGHTCLLVALNDRHVASPAALRERSNEVRLAAALSWSRRATLLAGLLRDFGPDWVSWQLVPYGFHPKGVLPPACFALTNAVRPWPNQVMLHELWLGLARPRRLGERLMGACQRARLLAFLRRLRPDRLQTTNPAYRAALARHGWDAAVLPLFGNIPIAPVDAAAAAAALAMVPEAAAWPAEPRWVAVLFGTIHPQWRPEPTLTWLERAAALARRRLAVLAVGRIGRTGETTLARLARRPAAPLLAAAGAQSPEAISHLLQAADFGLATHPWNLIAKSGSTATLLEHGLPVLVPRDDWHPVHGGAGTPEDPLLTRLDDLEPAAFPAWLGRRRAPSSRLPAVAAGFLATLGAPVDRDALPA